jgi:hypothetical protein
MWQPRTGFASTYVATSSVDRGDPVYADYNADYNAADNAADNAAADNDDDNAAVQVHAAVGTSVASYGSRRTNAYGDEFNATGDQPDGTKWSRNERFYRLNANCAYRSNPGLHYW